MSAELINGIEILIRDVEQAGGSTTVGWARMALAHYPAGRQDEILRAAHERGAVYRLELDPELFDTDTLVR